MCAIDKTSSAELTEAINSLHKWHENSTACCYIPDVQKEIQSDGSSRLSGFYTSGWASL
jgi:hypothetical protein